MSKGRIFPKDKFMYRVAPAYMNNISASKARKERKTELSILMFLGRMYNFGKNKSSITIRKVSKDRYVSTRTVDRSLATLKKNGLISVYEQGYCIRAKNRNAMKGSATVYCLTQRGLTFLNNVTAGFFAGIKRVSQQVAKKGLDDYVMQIVRTRYSKLTGEELQEKINEIKKDPRFIPRAPA